MASQLFTDLVTTVFSSWLNDVDTSAYAVVNPLVGTNTLTGVGPLSLTAYKVGQRFYFAPAANNTGPVTLNINSLGAVAITKYGGSPLQAGDLVAGVAAIVVFDGFNFQFLTVRQDTNYPPSAGGPVAYTAAPMSPYTLAIGARATFTLNVTNTGAAATLNVNGTGAFPIKVMDFTGAKNDPGVGGLVAGVPTIAVFDGVNYLVYQEKAAPLPPSQLGRLLNVRSFVASGTYTPTAGTNAILFMPTGGGGGGGGAAATGVSQASTGAGGNAGGTSIHYANTGFSGQPFTIGAGGLTNLGAAGGNGGDTTFLGVVGKGGVGGAGGIVVSSTGAATFTNQNSAPVIGTGANILNGAEILGGLGFVFSGAYLIGGSGGNSNYGGGGRGLIAAGGSAANAVGRGSGGGGASQLASGVALAGGLGVGGALLVYEFS